jgi:hypothetical protein
MGAEGVVLADFEPADRMPIVRGVTTGVSSRAFSSELILPAKTPVLPDTLPCLQGGRSSSESSGSMLQQNDKAHILFYYKKEIKVIQFFQDVWILTSASRNNSPDSISP